MSPRSQTLGDVFVSFLLWFKAPWITVALDTALPRSLSPQRVWDTKHFTLWRHFKQQRLWKAPSAMCLRRLELEVGPTWHDLNCGLKAMSPKNSLSGEGAHLVTLNKESDSEKQSLLVFRSLRRNSEFAWLGIFWIACDLILWTNPLRPATVWGWGRYPFT